jgi:hypothetical protein
MWNSRTGVSRAIDASWKASSSSIVYAPCSFGVRANEQNVHVARRMQTLVGFRCWFAEMKTRSPFGRG